MRYLITGFNSLTGEIFRAEERDQAGAEHCASSWCEQQPLGSNAHILSGPPAWFETPGLDMSQAYVVSGCKRVMGGLEWLP